MYRTRNDLKKTKLFKDFCEKRNLSEPTINTMTSVLYNYCKINGMTLQQLHDEADEEEEQRIREKNRKIIDRLETYRQTLIQKGYATNTIVESFNKVKTFYRTFRLEVPYIPPLKLPRKQMMYEDIPNKTHIEAVLNSTGYPMHRAMILFMYSSCSALAETLSVTCQMFVDATKEYHDKENINDVIKSLKDKDDIIPLFLLSRQKRSNAIEEGYKYYTCCTPEASKEILRYLNYRKNRRTLRNGDYLFPISAGGAKSSFKRLNDKQGWGKIGNNRFFRSHSLRYAGNTAIENEADGDLFSGRKRNPIHETYFKKNPYKIKELYMKYIPELSIQDTSVHDIKSKEYKKLENENKELSERISSLETKETKKNKADILATNLTDDQLDKMLSFLKKE